MHRGARLIGDDEILRVEGICRPPSWRKNLGRCPAAASGQ